MNYDGDQDQISEVVTRIDSHATLLRAWTLPGGTSAQITALEIEHRGGYREKWVVRQHGDADFARNPNIAADEFRVLTLLQSAGIPAPRPISVDDSGAIFARPYLVQAFVEGTPLDDISAPDVLSQLAAALAQIHRAPFTEAECVFLPRQVDASKRMVHSSPAVLDEALNEGRIREALAAIWPPAQVNASVLLHGDYWPGNTLWNDGRLAAVIDWEDAAWGDPLADLAKARLEIVMAFGGEAMADFTQAYLSAMRLDCDALPVWDLRAALRLTGKMAGWRLGARTLEIMQERHREFVDQALEELQKSL